MDLILVSNNKDLSQDLYLSDIQCVYSFEVEIYMEHSK